MKKVFKKSLALILALLCAMNLSVVTFAAEEDSPVTSGSCGENLTWEFDEATGTLTINGEGKMENYLYEDHAPWYNADKSITSVLIESGVTSIGDYAFCSYSSELKDVFIPDTIVNIGDYAFSKNTVLTEFSIPGSVKIIGNCAFSECTSLTEVTIEKGVTEIGKSAFLDCSSLAMITLPDSIIRIGDYAFENCTNLVDFTVPDSVTSLGYNICYNSGYSNNAANWDETKVLYNGKYVIDSDNYGYRDGYEVKDGTVCLADGAFGYFNKGADLSIRLPSSVKYIGDCAFKGCSYVKVNEENPYYKNYGGEFSMLLTKDGTEFIHYANTSQSNQRVTVPDGVVKICESAFEDSQNIIEVSLPDTVEVIDDSAFGYCQTLASINIPDRVKIIGNGAFSVCKSITSLTLPEGLVSIGDRAFATCYALESINIPESTESIGTYAFRGVKFTEVVIPKNVTEIKEGTFDVCRNLTTVTIPESVVSIGTRAFEDCTSLKNIYIPDSVERVENGAFSGCSALERVEIGNGDTTIEMNVFSYCESLTDLTIGDGDPIIYSSAFSNCVSLENISIGDGIPKIDNNAFDETAYYKNSDNWDNNVLYVSNHIIKTSEAKVSGSYAVKDGTITIADYAFSSNKNLTEVTIPDTTRYIGQGAFERCRNLSDVSIGSGVSTIRENAFADCSSLKNIVVNAENKVYFTDEQGVLYDVNQEIMVAFPCEKGIVDYTIPASVTTFYDDGFKYATELEKLFVEEGNKVLSSDRYGVLYDENKTVLIHYPVSSGNTKYIIPDGVEVINPYAFSGSKNLKEIYIPDSVKEIGYFSLSFCKNLEKITIGSGLVGSDDAMELLFLGCPKLEKIQVSEENAFYSSDDNGILYNKDKTAIIRVPAKSVGESFAIPDTVKTVAMDAFIDCEDFSLFIPNSFEDLGFITYTSANEYIVNDDHPYLKTIDGVLYAHTVDDDGKEEFGIAKYPVDSEREVLVVPEDVTVGFSELAFITNTADSYLANLHWLNIDEDDIEPIKLPENLTVYAPLTIAQTCVYGLKHVFVCTEENGESVEDEVAGLNANRDYLVSSWETEKEERLKSWPKNSAAGLAYKKSYDALINSTPYFAVCEGDHTQTHPYTSATKEATCKTEGVVTYTCSCGDTYTEVIPKKAHSWSEWSVITAPTNKLEGLQQRNCSACGETENGTIPVNGYSLGEETYSFANYSDFHWDTWLPNLVSGHCFGMSVTSSAYYLDLLNVSDVGIADCSKLNGVNQNTAKNNICKYQVIQGSYSNNAIVAGGRYEKSNYSSGAINRELDWKEVINYVKDGNHNYKGDLQVAYYYGKLKSGHAVNFIDYRVVNGQERIYVYDNNFPNDANVYFYFENGMIYSYAGGTTEEVSSISLHDIRLYMQNAKGYTPSKTLFAKEGQISVSNAKEYRMLGATEDSVVWCMYEIEDGVTSVTITPLTEDAAFVYMDEGYTFDGMKAGILKLSTTEDVDKSNEVWNPGLKVNSVTVNDVTLNYKNSAVIETVVDADEGVEYTKSYVSSNAKVATVDENGNITTHGRGSATVTCTVTDKYGNTVTDTCEVTVKYTPWQWIIKILLFGWIWY